MALVDYASDSESDSEPASQTKATPTPAPSNPLNLPPPKNTKTISKKPVKIVLESSSLSSSPNNNNNNNNNNNKNNNNNNNNPPPSPPAKKRKLGTDSTAAGLTGLAALLPPPKSKSSSSSKTTAATNTASSIATIPKESQENEIKPDHDNEKEEQEQEQEQEQDQPQQESVSFFSSNITINDTSKTPSVSKATHQPNSTTTTTKPIKISSTAIIDDNTTDASKKTPNMYTTLPPPSASNPYPGFHSLPSGQWVPDDPQAWKEYCQEYQQFNDQQQNNFDLHSAPKGFDQHSIQSATNVTQTIGKYDPQADNTKKAQPKGAKKAGGLARSRHQLTSLLASAQENRQEIEERIHQAKNNRRSGASKYGF